jgi:Spy/CpxP family protein refolding chaperone
MLLIFSILLLGLNAPALAQMGHMKEGTHSSKPQHREMGHGKGMHEASCWMKSLTAEQKATGAKLRLEFKKVKSLLKAKITVKKVELAILVTQDSPDQNAIDKKINEILELKREKMRKKYAFKVDMRSILTPEQRVSFDMHLLKKAQHGKGHGYKKEHGYR